MRKIAVPTLFRWLSSLTFLSVVTACQTVTPPFEEYTMARSAHQAAQDADAARFAGGLWQKADENFGRGEKAYKDNDFPEAKAYFVKAQTLSERAENATRLKKFQSGDSFP